MEIQHLLENVRFVVGLYPNISDFVRNVKRTIKRSLISDGERRLGWKGGITPKIRLIV
jgi:hypothetical protein